MNLRVSSRGKILTILCVWSASRGSALLVTGSVTFHLEKTSKIAYTPLEIVRRRVGVGRCQLPIGKMLRA